MSGSTYGCVKGGQRRAVERRWLCCDRLCRTTRMVLEKEAHVKHLHGVDGAVEHPSTPFEESCA